MPRFVRLTSVQLKAIKEELTESEKRFYKDAKTIGFEPISHQEIDFNVDDIISMNEYNGVTYLAVRSFSADSSDYYKVLETKEEIYKAEKREL